MYVWHVIHGILLTSACQADIPSYQ